MSTLESFVAKLEALPAASILRVCDLILKEPDTDALLAEPAPDLKEPAPDLSLIDQMLLERLRCAIRKAQEELAGSQR